MKDKNTLINSLKLLQRFARLKTNFSNNYYSIRRKTIVFLIFVFLSTILWFYRALDDTFMANISYPVRYQNLPKNKVLISTPPERILLKVRGNGYDLLSNKLKFKTPLNFNINSFLFYSQAKDSMSVYILSRYAKDALSEELNKKSSAMEIISIAPDTIFFSFTRTQVKKIAIKTPLINENNLFSKQHMQNGAIILSPDSINIIGPATIIDTINFVYTKSIQPHELTDTFRKKISILKINKVNLSVDHTYLTIPVDKYTEISYNVPISSKRVPDSINMKLFPHKVKLSFNITHSYISKITENDFRPYVDYNQLIELKNESIGRLSIKIDSIPPFIHALRMYPSSVEFINELNNVNNRYYRGNR